MNRDQMKVALDEAISRTTLAQDRAQRAEGHASDAKENAFSALRALERLRDAVRPAPVPAPEPEPEPVEPEPDGMWGEITDSGGFFMQLGRSARNSDNCYWPRGGVQRLFIEQFITTRAGITETVCVLHNGAPKDRGAIRIPKLEVLTHDGRSIFDWQGPVTTEPGGMLVVRDYSGGDARRGLSQAELQRRFWFALAYEVKAVSAIDGDLAYLLDVELDKQIHNPVTVGPYDVMWGSRGDEVGGAGTEPDWFEWRRCPAGYALAALEMYRTANRTSRCMTDDEGAFTWDSGTAYTSVGDFMPDEFKWDPRDATEQAIASFKNHDGQHFFRAYRAAMALARETKHPFAMWYLSCLANHQQAAHLGTRGDDATQHWWSLKKKLANVDGPNIWCGRQGVHEARFATEYARLFPRDGDARTLAAQYRQLFRASINENGVPFVMPTSAIVSEDAPQAWGADPAFQTFEIQLAILMFEDSGDPVLERAAKKLADYIGPFPPYVKNVKTGAGSGKANPYMNLATHGVGFATEEGMWKVTKERLASGGPESGGAVPANSFRPRRGIAKGGA